MSPIMNRPHKIITAFLVISYIIPIAVGFCCCLESSESGKKPSGHDRQSQSAFPEHSHGEHAGSPHSNSECNHAEIIADLVPVANFSSNEAVLISTRVFKNLFSGKELDSANRLLVGVSLPLENGPPGNHRLFLTPLYLQISVLRI